MQHELVAFVFVILIIIPQLNNVCVLGLRKAALFVTNTVDPAKCKHAYTVSTKFEDYITPTCFAVVKWAYQGKSNLLFIIIIIMKGAHAKIKRLGWLV